MGANPTTASFEQQLEELQAYDVYTASISPDVCDRRLSRAARRLLRELLQHSSTFDNDNDNDNDNDLASRHYPLHHTHTDRDSTLESATTVSSVWWWLEHWLPQHAQATECILFPSRDVLRHDEEHSIPIPRPRNVQSLRRAYPSRASTNMETQTTATTTATTTTTTTTTRITDSGGYSDGNSGVWWKCGYCGKTFLSRFYLDWHLQQHHHHPSTTTSTTTTTTTTTAMSSPSLSNGGMDPLLVCPAHTWCEQLFGMAQCHQRALLEEPYYNRGGTSPFSTSATTGQVWIQHQWTKLAHSSMFPTTCSTPELQATCQERLEECRVEEVDRIHLCGLWKCPSSSILEGNDDGSSDSGTTTTTNHDVQKNILRMMHSPTTTTTTRSIPHDWHETWKYHEQAPTTLDVLHVLLVSLLLLLTCWILYQITHDDKLNQKKQQKHDSTNNKSGSNNRMAKPTTISNINSSNATGLTQRRGTYEYTTHQYKAFVASSTSSANTNKRD